MTQLPSTRAHELDLTDGWLRIRFDRPAQRNALSANSVAELTDVLESVRHDRSVRGISFRGNGGVFCAGGDLQELSEIASAGARTESRALTVSHGAARLFECIDTAPQLTLSLVEGAAIGGGLGIACACDVVASTLDARFAITGTRIGLTPAPLAPYVLRRAGRGARRLMLLGSTLDARRAADLGLVDELAADAASLTEIEASIRKELLACAPRALAATKEVLRAAWRADQADFDELAAQRFAECMIGDEGREGLASFLERRRPSWTI